MISANTYRRFLRYVYLGVIGLMLVSCGAGGSTSLTPAPTPLSSASTPHIEVQRASRPPEKLVISVENIPQNNCGGTAAVTNEYEKSRTIAYTVELGGGVTVNASGEAGVPGVGKVQVGTEIAANYGLTYGQSETISQKLAVTAREGTNVNHNIQQIEYWEAGSVIIKVSDEIVGEYPYRLRTGFGLELVNSDTIDCNPSAASNPTVVRPSPAPSTPEPAPPPIRTTEAALPITADPSSGSILQAGGIWAQAGFEVQLKNPSFIPGCDGLLGFEMVIQNTSGKELLLDMTGRDVSATDEFGRSYSSEKIWWKTGSSSDDCYSQTMSEFTLRALKPGERVDLALRIEPQGSQSPSRFLITIARAGPISNAVWEFGLVQNPNHDKPNTAAGSILQPGEIWFQDGLELQLRNPSFIPGCDGVLGFELVIINRSGRELLLDMSGQDVSATDELGRSYSAAQLWWRQGGATESCYRESMSAFTLRALTPGERVDLAIRIEPQGSQSPARFLITIARAGPITNAVWEVAAP